MGINTKRPPLPAATESGTDTAVDDVETDVSRLTDRSSYSIPDDGSPITISTKKTRSKDASSKANDSQTSLLIEYFEGGKSKDRSSARPSVRVKVTPSSAKKARGKDAVQITEYGKDRKPSYTRRISLSGNNADQSASRAVEGTDLSHASDAHPPIEVELHNDYSDIASNISNPPIMHPTSDVSSMRADSILDGPLRFLPPEKKNTSRSLEENVESKGADRELATDSLKAPPRARSISRERILRKAAEKVTKEESSTKRRARRSRDSAGSNDIVEDAYEDYKARSRRSSKTQSRPESGDYRSGLESSYLRPREADSNVSGASKSSITNNPKLLQTVEDAIRRMILPEIDEIKRRQTNALGDRELQESSRKLSKSSSEPQFKPKVVLNRDEDNPGLTLAGDTIKHRKVRRSTREPVEDIAEGRERRYKSKESRRSSGGSEGLTAAALRDHNARSRERERRERRKQRSKSGSGSDSLANTDESYYNREKVPPMPMRSEVEDSDLTRESILSAETTAIEPERPTTGDSRNAPLVQEVSRGSPTTVPLPESRPSTRTPAGSRNRTPTQLEQINSPRSVGSRGDLRSTTSDRNISSKARSAALAAAGLGGAAGAMYGIGRLKAERSRSRDLQKPLLDNRDVSPVQTVSSYRKSDTFADEAERPVSRDIPNEPETKEPTARSMESVQSTGSAQYPLTQKRHQGVNLEKEDEVLEQHLDDQSISNQSEDEFYKEQQRLNDEYRSSGEFETQRDALPAEDNSKDLPQDENREGPRSEEHPGQQQVRAVAASAQVVGTPVRAESEVASLLEPSQLSSSRSLDAGEQSPAEKSPTDNQIQTPEDKQEQTNDQISRELPTQEPSPSQNRWAALRENARALSNSLESIDGTSPQQNVSRSVKSDEKVHMGASGLPVANDPLPEIGMGLDAASDSLTNPSLKEHASSVLAGPMGDENENRDHWPYEPTPPASKRHGWVETDDRDEPYVSAGNAALNGAVAGLGIGAAGAAVGAGATRDMQTQSQDSMRLLPSDSSASPDSYRDRNVAPQGRNTYTGYSNGGAAAQTPGYAKDEGYISAAPARSADDITPLSFSKPPPKHFDDRDLANYQNTPPGADPFVSDKRARYLSGNSHGMSSPQYDASTGKGINGIQSKDVVALMDHLTVRDGHRNARDTEILVTLVRSAAESRNAFDEVKKLIENGQQATMQHTDRGINKVLNAPRPQVLGSPREPQSTEDLPGKKRNIFKRAMKGLGSKSNNDLSRIEDMLNHLLSEVETLKGAQSNVNVNTGGSLLPRGSLDSYEQMRAAPESGYEPEGQAGTGSTPNQSGYFSPQSRQGQPRMHSGYVTSRDADNRVSTVLEGDEDMDNYNGEDRMLTPTQEVEQQRSTGFSVTPQRKSNEYRDMIEESPATDGRHQKTKSTSSSLWGANVPRISRWSKTTASSDNRTSIDTTPGRKGRPYSEASRSGSEVNVLPPDGAPWMTSEDDRLRSANSLAREADQSSSPLVPNPNSYAIPVPVGMEDPKYKANRKSLTLQHPQPRQGSTHRHQSNLENQASAFGGSPSDPRNLADAGYSSPDSDTFGSVPSLARLPGNVGQNRYSGSQYQYSKGAEQSALSSGGNAPRNTGPLIPPKVPLAQQYPHPDEDMYSNDSPVQDADSIDDSLDDDHGDVDAWDDDPAIPLPRKRSPYSPGGLLAPIEERYSMEGDRSSIGYSLSQKSRRESVDLKNANSANNSGGNTGHNSVDLGYQQQQQQQQQQGQGLADVMEQDEGEQRTMTPVMDPRPALGVPPATAEGAQVRKLTGPREMPRKNSSEAAGGLRGTVRRKPVVSGGWDD